MAERVAVEVLDSHGRVQARERFEIGETGCRFTVGRSISADVVVDAPQVAALHLAIEADRDGRVRVTDLGTRNGIVIDGKRHLGAKDHPLTGGEFKLGRVRVRVRTSNEVLSAEKLEHEIDLNFARNAAWVAGVSGLLWAGLVLYATWLEAPQDMPTVMAVSLTAAFSVAAVWIAIWALLSRMLRGEWRWMTHASIFFGVTAVLFVLGSVLDVGWFAFGLPQGEWRDALLVAVGLALVLYWHLTSASALRWHTAMMFASLIPVLVVGTSSWVQARNQARDVNYIGVKEKLYPPILRVRSGMHVDDYFAEAMRLKALADEKRKTMPRGDADAPDETID